MKIFATVAILLVGSICWADGERERIQIWAAFSRAGILERGEMPDRPPNMNLRNLRKGAAETPEGPTLLPAEERLVPIPLEDLEPVRTPEIPPVEVRTPASIRFSQPAAAAGGGVYQILVGTASWCGPCHSFENRVGSTQPKLAFRYVDIEKPKPDDVPADLWNAMIAKVNLGGTIPMLIWKDGKGVVRTPKNVMTAATPDQIVAVIEANDPPPLVGMVAASGMGGSIKARAQIEAAIVQWRKYIPDGQKLTMKLDRTGGTLNLLRSQDWKETDVFGKFGRFGISGLPPSIPIREHQLGFVFKFDDAGRPTFDADPFTLDLMTQQTVGASQAYGIGIDPLSVGFDLVYLAYGIYQMLHPQADLTLGGNVIWTVELADDTFVVTFLDTVPQIRVQAWMEWQLPVKTVSVNPRKAKIVFTGQERYWFKVDERELAVE